MLLTDTDLATWLFAAARIAGWALLDPLVGRLPIPLRVMLAAVLAAALAPGLAPAAVDPFSVLGVLQVAMELIRGAALALCVWLIFAAVEAIWVWSGHSATGGLLTLTPEQAASADAAWRALAAWLAAMAFLAAGGHLLVVDALRESFVTLPAGSLAVPDVNALAGAGAWLFSVGLQLALPVLALVLLIQFAWSIVARTTPGMNSFSVGLGLGMVSLMAAWIAAAPLVALAVRHGIEQLAVWVRMLVASVPGGA